MPVAVLNSFHLWHVTEVSGTEALASSANLFNVLCKNPLSYFLLTGCKSLTDRKVFVDLPDFEQTPYIEILVLGFTINKPKKKKNLSQNSVKQSFSLEHFKYTFRFM